MGLASMVHMVDLVVCTVVGFMVIACIQGMVGFMEVLGCMEVACTMEDMVVPWAVMGWAWVGLLATKIQMIHMALHHHQASGYP